MRLLESPLLNYALRLVADRNVAEDLVQDAFMKLHRQFAEVREPRRWLYRTVHNQALNHRRDTARIIPLVPANVDSAPESHPSYSTDVPDDTALPDEQIARLEGIGLVRLSLESLDERSRELVRLKFTEGLSYREMSERTGLTVSNIGYLLHHSLKAVEAELTRSGAF